MSATDSNALVAALLAVPGVAAAELDADDRADGAGTLRLELTSAADEVGVATAVNRLLREGFGLAVDADRVRLLDGRTAPDGQDLRRSVGRRRRGVATEPVLTAVPPAAAVPAAVPPAAPPPASVAPPAAQAPRLIDLSTRPAPDRRLAIDRVRFGVSGLDANAAVSLRMGDRELVGEARAAATDTGMLRVVAAATVRAIEQAAGDRVRFEVEHVDVMPTGTERTALCLVSMLTASGTERLPGASVVRGDVRHAVVRATLAAVNRRVELLLEDG